MSEVDQSAKAGLCEAALDYAARGFPVFPCKNNPNDKAIHKKPHTEHGFKDATTNLEQVADWWKRWPSALIGMPTGEASRIAVLDLDVKDGKNGFAAVPDWEKRSSVIVRTGSGGAHLYFRDDGMIPSQSNQIAPGVDTRGRGGYVIVPPSTGYRWQNGSDLSSLPPWPDDLRPPKKERPPREASTVTGGDHERRLISAALDVIPSDCDYETWFQIGAALHKTLGDDGFALFDTWSQKSTKYDARECDRQWHHCATITEFTVGTIFHHASVASPTWRAAVELPKIQIHIGKLSQSVDATQAALANAKLPVLVRGWTLVEPLWTEYPTAKGNKTKVSVLRSLTVPTLAYMITKHAVTFEKYDGRKKKFAPMDPPPNVLNSLLELGHWPFPRVAGVINAPTLRPDGTILDQPGYDAATQLWYERDSNLKLPDIPERPTMDDAKRALQLLIDLFSGFPFVSEIDRSVALAAFLTAGLRGAFELAPLCLFHAPSAGTGKSFLVDVISTIVSGRPCPVTTVNRSAEEMDKKLWAIIMEGPPLISLDNATVNLEGDILCQMVERPRVRNRTLGESKTTECEWRGTVFATGNNISLKGDMTRRGIVCHMDAHRELPETREFTFNPIDRVLNDRGAYIAAALTIARAYLVSGQKAECSALGSYGDGWGRFVREPLIWLGEPDPVKSMEEARANDPERGAARALIEQWLAHLGVDKSYSVAEVIENARATQAAASFGVGHANFEFVRPEFNAFLSEHCLGPRGLDPRKLGDWLKRIKGQVHDGYRIVIARVSKGHGNRWQLEKG